MAPPRVFATTALALCLAAPSRAAPPDPAARAEKLHLQALELADESRWKAAAELWRSALALHPDWRFGLNLASTETYLAEWLPAWVALAEAKRLGARVHRAEIVASLEGLIRARLERDHAYLELRVMPADAAVSLDGTAWQPPHAGWARGTRSALVAERAGYRPEEVVWEHPPGGSYTLDLELERRPNASGDTWETVGDAPEMVGHTATLLADGRVLLTGGLATPADSSKVPPDAVRRATLYNPRERGFTPAAAMTVARAHHTATRLQDGRVLVVGGHPNPSASTGKSHDSVEIYDPKGGSWQPGPPLVSPRYDHTAVLLPDGQVLVAGGADDTSQTRTLTLLDPRQTGWTIPSAALLPAGARNLTTALLPTGEVLLLGGAAGFKQFHDTVTLFDPHAFRTTVLPARLEVPRAWAQHASLPDGSVLIAGGRGPAPLGTCELFDPHDRTLREVAHPGQAPENGTLVALSDGRLLHIGGWLQDGPSDSRRVLVYTPVRGGYWRIGPPLPQPRGDHTATRLLDGTVVVVGGRDVRAGYYRTAELFQP